MNKLVILSSKIIMFVVDFFIFLSFATIVVGYLNEAKPQNYDGAVVIILVGWSILFILFVAGVIMQIVLANKKTGG